MVVYVGFSFCVLGIRWPHRALAGEQSIEICRYVAALSSFIIYQYISPGSLTHSSWNIFPRDNVFRCSHGSITQPYSPPSLSWHSVSELSASKLRLIRASPPARDLEIAFTGAFSTFLEGRRGGFFPAQREPCRWGAEPYSGEQSAAGPAAAFALFGVHCALPGYGWYMAAMARCVRS
jgi:hypothetical protein